MLFMLGSERLLTQTGHSLHNSVPVILNLPHTKLSFVFCKAPFFFLLLRFNRRLLHFWMRYEGPEVSCSCLWVGKMFLSAFNLFNSWNISQIPYSFSLLWPVKPGVQVFSTYQDYVGFRNTMILSSRVSHLYLWILLKELYLNYFSPHYYVGAY